MQVNQWVKRIHKMAVQKGWWEKNRSALEVHALIISEVAEAIEQVRKGKPDVYEGPDGKPEGEAVELADAVIRIMDYFGHKEWNLESIIRWKVKFNAKRSYRHGGKKF